MLMLNIEYDNLLDKLKYIAESAIDQLRLVLEEVDFTTLSQSIKHKRIVGGQCWKKYWFR